MCRWNAYFGQPVAIDELLFKTDHGLIDQSLHSRMGVETTNGDGFGVGWYGAAPTPGVFHGIEPAWNDRNLRELALHVASPLVLAHIRASSGSAVQETNCCAPSSEAASGVHDQLANLMRKYDVNEYAASVKVWESLCLYPSMSRQTLRPSERSS